MKIFKVEFNANYCGADREIYVLSKQTCEEAFGEENGHFLDEIASNIAIESFGVENGDYIDDEDEEEGNEALQVFWTVSEADEDELGLEYMEEADLANGLQD